MTMIYDEYITDIYNVILISNSKFKIRKINGR